jgi:hypothetical protein
MVRSKERWRRLLGDKLLDLANYAAAALVFSQFVSQQAISWRVVLAGMAMWSVLAVMSYWLAGEP